MKMGGPRAVWLDNLRSFVTLLVVAHHAALAYPTFAYFDAKRYINSTAPIVDDSRWVGMDTLIGFNDIFFMPLMFLISGLFVYRGLLKKGAKTYLTDRFIRLGIPFLVAEVLIIPLAYAPTFYQATHSTDASVFLKDYVFNQQWPVGPPWFIWLLLAFDGVTTLIFTFAPSFFPTVGNWLGSLSKHPVRFGFVLYSMTAIALIPLSLGVGQYTWVGEWGPFDFQLNRLFFYLLFFLVGAGLGSADWQKNLFCQDRLFGINWPFWIVLSLLGYVLVRLVSETGIVLVKQGGLSATVGYFLYDLAFVASCLASMGACLSFFKQILTKPGNGWASLSVNAYGIYVVHYMFITWFQFALLGVAVPVILKFGLVFSGALVVSWLTVHFVRRSSPGARIL